MTPRKPSVRTPVVLSVLVLVVAVVAFLQHRSSVLAAEEATLRGQLFMLRAAIDEYEADTGACPTSLSQLVAAKYLPAIPVDPSTNSSETWQYTQTRTGQRTVCDVNTGSSKIAKDGRRYAEW